MELFQEILLNRLLQGGVQVTIPVIDFNPAEIVEKECYQALRKIKAVIEDDSLDDRECFMKIEEIIVVLEELGSDGGFRHDFG